MTATLTNDKAAALDALQDPAVAARFWAKVDRRSPAECWEWTAGLARGYGTFGINRRMYLAHRVAYVLAHGPLPEDQPVVRHQCDNPPCVNPAHLQAGTHADNMRDRDERGRTRRAVLTEELVAEARRRVRAGEYVTDVANSMAVNQDTLRQAVRGRRWPGEVLGEAPVPSTRSRKDTHHG